MMGSVRRLTEITPFTDCFPNQNLHTHAIRIAFVIDITYRNEFDTEEQMLLHLNSVVTAVNTIYYNQLNVEILAGDVLAGEPAGFAANGDCAAQSTIQKQLVAMYNWKKSTTVKKKYINSYICYSLFFKVL